MEDEELLTDIFETEKFRSYEFDTDKNILYSFDKAFKDYKIIYTPYKRNKFINVNYLLDRLDVSENLPREIYDHFNSNLTNLRKKTRKIPAQYIDDQMILTNNVTSQTGKSINDNIQINSKDLDKGILRVRYSNNRKLTNNLLKDDYEISK